MKRLSHCFVLSVIASILLLTGCRKADSVTTPEVQNENLNAEKFFTQHSSENPAIKAAQQFVKSQDDKYHFASDLIKKVGFPFWNKSLVFSTVNFPNFASTESGENQSTTVYIPFVQQSANEITTSLAINITGTDTSFRFIYDWQYFTLPRSGNNVPDTSYTAEEHALLFMQMDKAVFGHTNFVLTDPLLFKNVAPIIPGTTKRKLYLNQSTLGNITEVWRSGFVDLTFASYHCTLVPGYCSTESCDMCSQCVSYYQLEQYLTWWEPDPPSQGNQGGNQGGGGGSQGASNWTPQQECMDDPFTPENECPIGGWVPGSQQTVMDYLSMHLTLTEEQVSFLNINSTEITGIYNYLSQNYSEDAKNNSVGHISRMMADMPYFDFVTNYRATGSSVASWWVDDNFLLPQGGVSFGTWAIKYLTLNPSIPFETFHIQFFKTSSEGPDEDHDASYWDDPNLSLPTQNLPTWSNFSSAYPKRSDPAYNTPQKIYTAIGGQVLGMYNTNPALFQNTCAIRVSKALNNSGVTIPAGPDRYQGADGKYYFLGATALLKWMKKTFGTPTGTNRLSGSQGGTNGQNFPSLLAGKKGIYIMTPNYPGGCGTPTTPATGFCASGHADMINNGVCDGGCYFNPNGGVHEIFVWILQ